MCEFAYVRIRRAANSRTCEFACFELKARIRMRICANRAFCDILTVLEAAKAITREKYSIELILNIVLVCLDGFMNTF